ncbi:hypothetical protein ABW19_dt0201368 [Dactylella cylindrospora]|nr:hypothetical protein ABW19_dt0201368 [Dactylella cylindrospora]
MIPRLDEILDLAKATYRKLSQSETRSRLKKTRSRPQSSNGSSASGKSPGYLPVPSESTDLEDEIVFSVQPSLEYVESVGKILSSASSSLSGTHLYDDEASFCMSIDESFDDRMEAWIEEIGEVNDEMLSGLRHPGSLYSRLGAFTLIGEGYFDSGVDLLESEIQCDLFLEDFKEQKPAWFQSSILYIRALFFKSMILRKKNPHDISADAWSAFAENLMRNVLETLSEEEAQRLIESFGTPAKLRVPPVDSAGGMDFLHQVRDRNLLNEGVFWGIYFRDGSIPGRPLLLANFPNPSRIKFLPNRTIDEPNGYLLRKGIMSSTSE